VAAGANCTLSITFTPKATGSRTASVAITDNATGSPQSVSLTGTGTAPAASLSPSSLSFGNQVVSTTSAAQTITLTNTGNATLSITSLALTGSNAGDFTQTNTCGSSVAAGANCTLSITFTPAASGSRTASVAITDNAAGSPQTVALSGTGLTMLISLNPTSSAFGVVVLSSDPSLPVIITNTGTASVTVSQATVTGTGFSLSGLTLPFTLSAGQNTSLNVTFSPTAVGSVTGNIAIVSNATNSPSNEPLSGTGIHGVSLSWTASTSSGVEGYNVYRGTGSGGESTTPLNSTPITATTYTDENVTAGTTYYYVVTAVATGGTTQSVDSNEASATVPTP
jgi:hypothetical protein